MNCWMIGGFLSLSLLALIEKKNAVIIEFLPYTYTVKKKLWEKSSGLCELLNIEFGENVWHPCKV